MHSVLIVGLGEVGSAIYEIAIESKKFAVYGYDVNPHKTRNRLDEIPRPINYLHIAIPYTSNFTNIVIEYIEKFSPEIVFIHSTVAPGTTRKILDATNKPIAYTPVRGKHPNMKRHLLFWSKWIVTIPQSIVCLLYTSPSPRDISGSRMPSSA